MKIVQPVDLEHCQRASKVVAFGAHDLFAEPGAEGLDRDRSGQRVTAAAQEIQLELGDACAGRGQRTRESFAFGSPGHCSA